MNNAPKVEVDIPQRTNEMEEVANYFSDLPPITGTYPLMHTISTESYSIHSNELPNIQYCQTTSPSGQFEQPTPQYAEPSFDAVPPPNTQTIEDYSFQQMDPTLFAQWLSYCYQSQQPFGYFPQGYSMFPQFSPTQFQEVQPMTKDDQTELFRMEEDNQKRESFEHLPHLDEMNQRPFVNAMPVEWSDDLGMVGIELPQVAQNSGNHSDNDADDEAEVKEAKEEKKQKKPKQQLLPFQPVQKRGKKRGRKPQFEGVERQKLRKRINRKMSNRNDYGRSGHLIYWLLRKGCTITFDKVTEKKEKVKYRKLKINYVKFGETCLLNRQDVERRVRCILAEHDVPNRTRAFRNYMNIEIDNLLLEILETTFGLRIRREEKKSPINGYMPQRVACIGIDNVTYPEPNVDVVVWGKRFYNELKLYFRDEENVDVTFEEYESRKREAQQ